ncbi:unnamed protein product [Caenorhabditis brenneri]
MATMDHGAEEEDEDDEPEPPVPKRSRVSGSSQATSSPSSSLRPSVKMQTSRVVLPVSAHKSFLELIQSLILTLKVPINRNVWNMEETIDKLTQFQILGRQMEEEVKIEDFHNIIISGVNIAKKNSSSTPGQEDLRSFKEFVLLLKMSQARLEEPENLEKRIPVYKIEKAVEMFLEILL